MCIIWVVIEQWMKNDCIKELSHWSRTTMCTQRGRAALCYIKAHIWIVINRYSQEVGWHNWSLFTSSNVTLNRISPIWVILLNNQCVVMIYDVIIINMHWSLGNVVYIKLLMLLLKASLFRERLCGFRRNACWRQLGGTGFEKLLDATYKNKRLARASAFHFLRDETGEDRSNTSG